MKRLIAAGAIVIVAVALAVFAVWVLRSTPAQDACGRHGGRLIDGNCYSGD